jgi:hypothetical protein
MKNKLFFLLILLAFFGSTNSAISMRPEANEWTDSSGHYAPAMVRKAADDLWDAVKREGAAAADNGWLKREDILCNQGRIPSIICCVITGGLYSLCWCPGLCCERLKAPGNDGEFSQNQNTDSTSTIALYQEPAMDIIYQQRKKEMDMALENFKEAINKNVLKPEQYSGDANICNLGPWVIDEDAGRVWNLPHSKYHSGHRDMSKVVNSTMSFVNNHGGWDTEKKGILEIKVEFNKVSHDDEEAELRKELLRAQIAALKGPKVGDGI